MRISLLEGTDFAEMGDRATPAEAIVNEEFCPPLPEWCRCESAAA